MLLDRCQYVSPTPWGGSQCTLPRDHGKTPHAFDPIEKELMEPIVDEHKYITFKRQEFFEMLGDWTARWMRTVEVPLLVNDCTNLEIPDAVVFRRQDRFASPCLLTYAAMIHIVSENHPDDGVSERLRAIADYFHEQGILAGDEGFKLPD